MGASRAPRSDLGQTKAIWYALLRNDLESANSTTSQTLSRSIFVSHLFHLGLVITWVSVNLMQIGWQGTYSEWVVSGQTGAGSAHAVRDPQLGVSGIDGLSSRIISTSGLYHWLYALGYRHNSELMVSATLLFVGASLLTVGGLFHAMHLSAAGNSNLDGSSIFVNQLSTGIGLASILWSGHIIHVAGPVSRGIAISWSTLLLVLPHSDGLSPLLSLRWHEYSTILSASSLDGGPVTLTDIAHHHLALGIVCIILGHLSRSVTLPTIPFTLHFGLATSLAALGTFSSFAAVHLEIFPVYDGLDTTSLASLYTHHQYIAGFFLLGAFSHGAIYLVRDYQPLATEHRLVSRLLAHRAVIISHLSSV